VTAGDSEKQRYFLDISFYSPIISWEDSFLMGKNQRLFFVEKGNQGKVRQYNIIIKKGRKCFKRFQPS
jgi:hypothetical protein